MFTVRWVAHHHEDDASKTELSLLPVLDAIYEVLYRPASVDAGARTWEMSRTAFSYLMKAAMKYANGLGRRGHESDSGIQGVLIVLRAGSTTQSRR